MTEPGLSLQREQYSDRGFFKTNNYPSESFTYRFRRFSLKIQISLLRETRLRSFCRALLSLYREGNGVGIGYRAWSETALIASCQSSIPSLIVQMMQLTDLDDAIEFYPDSEHSLKTHNYLSESMLFIRAHNITLEGTIAPAL